MQAEDIKLFAASNNSLHIGIKSLLTADFLLPSFAHLFRGENGDRHPAPLRFDGEPVPFSQGLALCSPFQGENGDSS